MPIERAEIDQAYLAAAGQENESRREASRDRGAHDRASLVMPPPNDAMNSRRLIHPSRKEALGADICAAHTAVMVYTPA